MIKETLDLLGKRATDVVTGFEGVITSISFDLYGCVMVIISPQAGENGKMEPSKWFDKNRIRIKHACDPVMTRPDFEKQEPPGPEEKPAGRW